MKVDFFSIGLVSLFLSIQGVCAATPQQDWPQKAKPWVFYHWLNGNISKAGITQDIEAMSEQGIGGVLIFNLGVKYPEGPVKYLSSEWFDLLKHTCSEAERHRMLVSIMNCDGWATAGGPGVTPEESMKKLTFNRTYVSGGQEINIDLTEPESNLGFYRDVAVLAYPTRWKPENMLKSKGATISLVLKGRANTEVLTDSSIYESTWLGQSSLNGGNDIEVEFNQPTLIDRCLVAWDENNMPNSYEVYAEHADGTKHLLCEGKIQDDMMWSGEVDTVPLIATFPAVCASRFVVRLKSNKFFNMKVNEVDLMGPDDGNGCAPLVNDLFCKSAFIQRMRTVGPSPDVTSKYVIAKDEIYNLTDKMSPSGHLLWNAPDGKWTILRIGYTSTGKENYPATAEGTGLECDKLSKTGLSSYFKKNVMPIIDALSKYKESSFRFVHSDSWEAHSQNWTDDMPVEFASRMNYDMTSFLPVFSGEIVEGVNESEQFLRDFRSIISGLLKDNYYLHFKELVEQQGLEFFSEPCGMQQCYSDFVDIAAEMPWTATEIWTPTKDHWINPMIRRGFVEVVSAAHLQNRSWISIEGLTSGLGDYLKDPALCKPYLDCAYASGVNHFIIHSYVHQPDERVPGWSMNPWGMAFHRHLTWWNQAHLMTDYMTACQKELQQGMPVVDLLMLYSSDSPGNLHGHPGHRSKNAIGFSGFKYDAVNTDILFNGIKLNDQIFCTESGMQYRALIVPQDISYSPEQIEQLSRWIKSGAIIFVRSDDDLKDMKMALLPEGVDPLEIPVHAMQQGRQAKTLLESCGLSADLSVKSGSLEQTDILFNHRKYEDTDSYFLCNQTASSLSITPTFRAKADSVEIYDPEMKQTHSGVSFNVDEGRTTVPLILNPHGSVFVRLTQTTSDSSFRVLNIQEDDGNPVPVPSTQLPLTVEQASFVRRVWMGASGQCTVQETSEKPQVLYSAGVQALADLSSDWEVSFTFRDGRQKTVTMQQLVSWTDLNDDELKHFSGTAVYRKKINLSDELKKDRKVFLKVAKVGNIARIRINGADTGSVWKEPYVLDITDGLQLGENEIEIEVINLWVNELIYEAGLPEDQRKTWSNVQQYKAGDKPLESGLIGPLKLLALDAMESSPVSVDSSTDLAEKMIYRDDFCGTSSTPLDKTAPDVRFGPGVWNAVPDWTADGHVRNASGIGRSTTAYLSFTPQNGKVYSYSVDMRAVSTANTDNWVAMGFLIGTETATHPINQDAVTVYLRKNGQLNITGANITKDSGMAKLETGSDSATVEIVLDTTGENWTFTVNQNGSQMSTWHFISNPSIVGVGLGKFSDIEAQFDNSALVEVIPCQGPALFE